MLELLRLVLGTFRVALCSRRTVLLENLVLRQQLAVALRPRRCPRLTRRDRLFWLLVRRLTADWRRHLVLVSPDTVVRWHRQGWRLFWRWRSRTRLGRPHLPAEVRELIATRSREHVLWGSERIRGELLKLGITVSNRSVRRYRWRSPARPPSQTWRTFLANHAHAIWAADLFTVHTLTFRTLYVLCFIGHGRREVLHFRVTAHPTAAWVGQHLRNATPWGRSPPYLLRDRDRVYGGDFGAKLKRLGIEQLLTPVRAPRANAVAERLVGTFRRECLDHVLIVNERHLHALLKEFTAYYNQQRSHRTLRLAPWRRRCPPPAPPPARSARGRCSGGSTIATTASPDHGWHCAVPQRRQPDPGLPLGAASGAGPPGWGGVVVGRACRAASPPRSAPPRRAASRPAYRRRGPGAGRPPGPVASRPKSCEYSV